jgi:hypothetical protein
VTDARKIRGVTAVRLDQSSATLTLRFDAAQTDERVVAAAVQAIVDRLE